MTSEQNNTEVESIAMMIVTYAGTAKSSAMESINCAKNNDYKAAEDLIKDAKENLKLANSEHYKAIQLEASNKLKISLLLMHAEDQMLNAETIIALAEQMIVMWKEIKGK